MLTEKELGVRPFSRFSRRGTLDKKYPEAVHFWPAFQLGSRLPFFVNTSRTKNAASAATRRTTVNKDRVSGKVEQAVGKVKQAVGETVGNEKLANQGVVDQAKGAAKETWGNAKDAAKQVHQSHKDAATEKAHENRNKISQSVQDAKEKATEKINEFKERHSA
jgi:uncharacterized protein YjbJ (UPF0337 family)